jgi:MFS family permease
MLVLMNAVYALAAWPAGALSDRIGRFGVLAAGFAVLALADLALAFGAGIASVALGIALWGLHMGLTQGVLASLVADTAPADLRGTAYGMFNLVGGTAMLAASVVAGALWDAFGPQATFAAGALFTVLALAGLPLARRRIARA